MRTGAFGCADGLVDNWAGGGEVDENDPVEESAGLWDGSCGTMSEALGDGRIGIG